MDSTIYGTPGGEDKTDAGALIEWLTEHGYTWTVIEALDTLRRPGRVQIIAHFDTRGATLPMWMIRRESSPRLDTSKTT